jgi:hypothetical protein
MEIATLAAWGEFIGGIAVVVSLVYLASQIRQNSKLLRASTASATQAMSHTNSSFLVQDPEVARIYFDGLADRSSLSEADQRRFDPLVAMHLQGNQQHYRFVRDGVMNHELWEDEVQALRWSAQQPGIRQWHSLWRHTLGNDFNKFFDGLIREGEAAA